MTATEARTLGRGSWRARRVASPALQQRLPVSQILHKQLLLTLLPVDVRRLHLRLQGDGSWQPAALFVRTSAPFHHNRRTSTASMAANTFFSAMIARQVASCPESCPEATRRGNQVGRAQGYAGKDDMSNKSNKVFACGLSEALLIGCLSTA